MTLDGLPQHGMVGRHSVLTALEHDLARAVRGQGRLVLLAGEPGIGKTTAASALADLSRGQQVDVRWGRAWDGDAAPGYWPWQRIARGLTSTTDLFSASQPHADARNAVFALFAEVVSAVEEAASRRPQLIVLDDLQWAGAGALRLLDFAARQLSRSPVLLLGTYRDTDVEPDAPIAEFLSGLPSEARIERLAGLTAGEVAALLGSATEDEIQPQLAESVRRRTGGNPFFVLQLASLPGMVANAAEQRSSPAIPAGVGEAVERRLSRLSPDCMALLEISAVFGGAVDTPLLASVWGADQARATELLDGAVTEGVLVWRESGQSSFTHDLFREVLYAGLSTSRRAAIHLSVSTELRHRRLRTGLPSAAEIARHLALAQPHVDPADVVAMATEAWTESLDALAYTDAARHCTLALRVCEQSGVGDPLELRLRLAETLSRAGHRERARSEFLIAARTADTARPSALGRLALGLHRLGAMSGASHAEVRDPLERAVGALSGADATDQLPLAALVRAALARELADGPQRDVERAAALAQEAVSLARSCGDGSALAFCLFAEHDVSWAPGTARRRLAIADEMAAAAGRAAAGDLLFEALLCRYVALLELADPLTEAALRDVERHAVELRLPRARYLATSRRTAWHIMTGDKSAVRDSMATADELAAAISEPDAFGVRATQLIGDTLIRVGAHGVAALVSSLGGGHIMPEDLESRERAFILLASGQTAAVATILRESPFSATTTDFRWRALAAVTFDVELALAVQAEDVLADRYEQLRPFDGEVVVIGGGVIVCGPVALYLGACAAALRRWDAAEEHLRAAMATAHRLGARPWVARAQTELAWALRNRGRRADVGVIEDLLKESASTASDLGLPGLLERQSAVGTAVHPSGELCRDGEIWTLSFAGRTIRVPDSKGLRDLAVLIAQPGVEVPAVRLLGGNPADDGPMTQPMGSDELLDSRARAAYRRRLEELQEVIDDAAADHDLGRLEAATDERQAILDELGRALGLGGRARRLGDPGERARTTVTARIRDRLRRLHSEHPELAAHLRQSVRTGRTCSYSPAEQVVWKL